MKIKNNLEYFKFHCNFTNKHLTYERNSKNKGKRVYDK